MMSDILGVVPEICIKTDVSMNLIGQDQKHCTPTSQSEPSKFQNSSLVSKVIFFLFI